MPINPQLSKLPLRDLLNQAEHRCRELAEHLHQDLSANVSELHKLTRPNRQKSAYPSTRSVSNGYERLRRSYDYAQQLAAQIEEVVAVIEERVARSGGR